MNTSKKTTNKSVKMGWIETYSTLIKEDGDKFEKAWREYDGDKFFFSFGTTWGGVTRTFEFDTVAELRGEMGDLRSWKVSEW